jgi:transposase
MVIPDERRYQLIKFVVFENVRVKEAAGALGINYQTAKSILRRYHMTGEITRQFKTIHIQNTTN